VVLVLGVAGVAVTVVAFLKTGPDSFRVSATTPATISAARGEEFTLGALVTDVTVATCTVVPADGDSRRVSLRPGWDSGYREPAWWSGTATITCDQPVVGKVLGRHWTARMVTFPAAATVVSLATFLTLVKLFD
jgi:hypothetical protein